MQRLISNSLLRVLPMIHADSYNNFRNQTMQQRESANDGWYEQP